MDDVFETLVENLKAVNPEPPAAPEVPPTLEAVPEPAPEVPEVAPTEAAPTPEAPRVKRKYAKRADGDKIRQQIVGFLTLGLKEGESLSAGQLAEVLEADAVVVGYHCRALHAIGKIGATGEKRGRKYHPVRS